MTTDKNKPVEYPKPNENDKRWKQQDEFDSSGPQRESEDKDKNDSIAQSPASSSNEEAEKKNV